jgi:hypothetical protein
MSQSEEDKVLEILEEDPLLAFSIYTHVQVKFLEQTATRIEAVLEEGIQGTHIQGGCFNEAYGLFWLWVLGAYEVVRTMSQHGDCFDSDLRSRILEIKRYLKRLRMPFAKQELPRWNRKEGIKPIWGELSVTDVDTANKDLRFRMEGHDLTARAALKEFRDFITSIELASIRGKIPTGPSPYA